MKHEHINALVSAREAKEKADVAYQKYLDTHEEFKAVEEERIMTVIENALGYIPEVEEIEA